MRARGPLLSLDARESNDARWWELDARRGGYDYDLQPDFFTADLIDGRAQALFRLGAALVAENKGEEARAPLQAAWSMHWDFPEPPLFLGYMAYAKSDFKEAKRYYGLAAGILDGLIAKAEEYHSLPAVAQNIRMSAAQAYMHLGVVAEKLGDRAEAERNYEFSLSRQPLAQTHYDLAILYWNRDWSRVERELQETLRLEPGHAEAARYLKKLQTAKGR